MDHRAVPGRDKQAGRILLIACVVAWCQGSVLAADTGALPSVTVTGNRDPESVSRQSNSVTVITAKDIERSTAQDVGTLLATEANLSLLSYTGNDKKASIDMRGMGITSISNVLILVDGERLTEIDQSGADLSTLSLSQIERIEVIRGGGGVRHGQGAVGGVISITTKRPEAGPVQGDALLRAGSFNSRAAQAAVRGGSDSVAAQVMLSHAKSDGYRDNSGQESNTVALEVRHLPQSDRGLVDLYARATLHEDTYGLPGPLSQQAFRGGEQSRRSSNSPLDGGSTQDYRLTVGGAYDWGSAGKMSLRLSARDRNNPFIIGASVAVDPETASGRVKSEREEVQWRYDLSHESNGMAQSLTLGIDAQNGRYARWYQGVAVEESRLVAGKAKTRSVFLDTNTSPVKELNIHAGIRQDWFKTSEGHFKYTRPCVYFPVWICSPDIVTVVDDAEAEVPTRRWRNQSAELGFSWAFAPRWSWFGSLSQHVRYPNLDDLALQAEDLRPQRGHTLDQGLRYVASTWSGSITAFAMRIKDEIYYGKNAVGFSENRNYEQATLRHGLELDARWRPSDRWFLRGQWSYVVPKFENAPGDPDIPLVPRSSLSGDLGWDVLPTLQWTLQATHASQRLDGDAFGNRSLNLPIVKGNTVVNTVWRLHQKSWQLSLGITNLFDEVYTNQANSGNAYPMPGRAAYVEWRLSN